MRKFIKIISTVFAILFSVSAVACSGNNGKDDGNYTDSINVIIIEEGYGSEWLQAIADKYYEKTNVKVFVTKSYIPSEIHSQIEGNVLPYDIAFAAGGTGVSAAESKRLLADLSDVYNATPEGYTIPLKDVMDKTIYEDLLYEDGSIYQMNWMNSKGGLIYNKTSLDTAYGEGNYSLPRTTDEWVEICNKLKADDKVYPLAVSPSCMYTYSAYALWQAQYDGIKAFKDFFNGYYYKDGVRTFAENGEIFDMPGRKKSLDAFASLFNKNTGYFSPNTVNMDYLNYQIAFLGHGYMNRDMKNYAFTVNGDWLENEMKTYLDSKPQEIRMMKMPMLSAIVETLEDKTMTDSKLREVITAIDNGETSFAGVSENDFKRLSEARHMNISGSLDLHIAVPKISDKVEQAKAFLIYMASSEAQQIMSDTTNGFTMPYGYKPTKCSDFIQSCYDVFDENSISVTNGNWTDLTLHGGLSIYYGAVDNSIFNGVTPDSILESTKNYFMSNGNWDVIKSLAKK